MQSTSITKADLTAEVAPPVVPASPWRVVTAETLSSMRLRVVFVDGTSGEVDLGAFLRSDQVPGTVFEPLGKSEFFGQVNVVHGTVEWPNGADLAPNTMYDAIRETGRWTP
jgi:hypothetical protein